MKPVLTCARLLTALALLAAAPACTRSRPAPAPVAVGRRAPDFALASTEGHTIRLADYRGQRTVVLAFFPKAFTPG